MGLFSALTFLDTPQTRPIHQIDVIQFNDYG